MHISPFLLPGLKIIYIIYNCIVGKVAYRYVIYLTKRHKGKTFLGATLDYGKEATPDSNLSSQKQVKRINNGK